MKRIIRGALFFALLWALALALPPVRQMTRVLPFLTRFNPDSGLSAIQFARLPRADPITIEWALSQDYDPNHRAEALRELDALAARSPDQLWILAARLRRTINPAPRFDTGTGAPSAQLSRADARELERAAAMAAKAGAREPDNSFWPYMEADFRFALRQNEAALSCIARAAQAAHFNAFERSTLQARLALWKKHDDPTWEEQLSLSFSSLWWHVAAMRDVSRAATVAAVDARKRGDNARALQIGAAVLRANEVWRRDSSVLIGSVLAESVGRDTLERLLDARPAKGLATPVDHSQHGRELQQKWARFARENGRTDLVSRANWLTEPAVSQRAREFWSQEFWSQFGLSGAQTRAAVLAPMVLFALAMLCLAWALTWLFGALTELRVKNGRSPARGQVVACANFGFWLLLGALVVANQTGALMDLFQPFGNFSGHETTPFGPLFYAVFAGSCWLLPVAFVNWKRERRFQLSRSRREARALGRGFGRARVVAWLLFFVFAVFVATDGRGLWDNTPFQLPISATIAFAGFLTALVLETIRFQRAGCALPRLQLSGEIESQTSAPPALKIARFGAWVVAALCGFLLVGASCGAFDLPPISSLAALPLLVAATVAGIKLGRKIGRGDGFGWRLAARSAGVLSLAWSAVFIVLALSVWPIRLELNRQLDRHFALREEDWMLEQIAKTPPGTLSP